MEFRILGPLEVSSDTGDVPLGGVQKRAVLALLLLHANEAVSVDRLVDELWPESPPKTAAKTVRVYVSQLRKALDGDGRLEASGRGYVLRLDDGDLDAARFDALLAEGRGLLAAGQPTRAAELLGEALGLWRGPPLADFVYEPFAQSAIARLEERRLVCLEERIEADLALGRHEDVIAELEALVRDHPLRERLRGQLMLALYRSGRQAEALEVYRSTRRTLSEELGLEPGPDLQALERQILNQDPALAAPLREPARLKSRPRRAWLVVTAGALVLAAALAAALVEVVGSDEAKLTSIAANAVGVVDPDTNRLVAQIPVERAPSAIATGLGDVWVVNTDDQIVSRIDPERSTVVDSIPVRGGPAGVAVCNGAVWVANGLDGTVSRIDPNTNQEAQMIPVGNGPSGVACGEGAVWVTNSADGTVIRIDPNTGRPSKPLPAIIGASGIAVGFRRIWVVSPPSNKVVVLDPGSGDVLKEIGVGVDPNAIAVGAGAAWVANRADGNVTEIDPRTLAVKDIVRVGRGPTGIAADGDEVWVTNARDGTLSHFDPSKPNEVEATSLDNPPNAVALAREGVYVAVGSSGKEHRGGELRVISDKPNHVDPALAYFVQELAMLNITNDGLVGLRKVSGVQGMQPVPDLAVSLPTRTDGGRTWTFQVRSRIRYSNGKLVQPEDFRRGLQRAFQLGMPQPQYYRRIVGADRCEKEKRCDLSRGIVTNRASRTVTIHLEEPDGELLTKLAMPWAYPVPEGTPVREATAANPVPATGPYRIAGYDRKTKTFRLVRNARFRLWSADAQPRGFPDTITVSTRSRSAGVRAVRRGLADIAPVSDSQYDVLAARYPDRLNRNTAFWTDFFFLNTHVAPFDDVRVRRAVNYAFDSQAFAAKQGPLYVPTCQILPPNFPGYQRRTCRYASNRPAALHRAQNLVDAAGARGARVTVWVPSFLAERGHYMESLLDSLGFRADVHKVDAKPDYADPYFTAVGDSRTNAQIGFGAWVQDYPSSTGFIPGFLSCASFVPNSSKDKNDNLSEFCDPSIDREMARASVLQAQDPAAATLLWQRVERELLAQAPLVPADNRGVVDFVSKRVGNYQYHPQWGALLSQLWVR